MYETLNYAELDKMRDALLIEAAGTVREDEAKLQIIGELTTEMEERESETAKRLRSVVVTVNVLVLALILFCAGCGKMLGGAGQMLDGFGDGVSYVGQHLQESVKEK